ncbi:MAG: choice-of-anchor D domain-containing protein [Myxococcaceae bacterium]|nr:choice-of-anchor D domain-containing protein [Myxococcaceae bacterium]
MTHRDVAVKAAFPKALLALVALFTLSLSACDDPKVVKTLCREDQDCEGGLLCEDFRCVEQKTKACGVVIDGNPILQPSPYTVAFGELDTAEATATLELHSIGNCTLTLFEAGLTKTGSPFDCGDFCTGKFPIEIFPNRNVPVTVKFKAKDVGKADDELKILSDDREFPEMRIPIHADFLGVPSLKATPNPIDFGYIAMGRQGTRNLTLTNQGTGIAPIEVKGMALAPIDTMDFGIDLTDVTFPFTLAPIAKDNKALKTFVLRYTPRSSAVHNIELVITTNKGEMRVPLKGNAETPPRFLVNPMMLNLGNVPYGATNVLPLTIQNEGGAPLKVTYMWGGSMNTDFSAAPAVIPAVTAGMYTELQVAFTNTSSTGMTTGLLVLSSNDPSKPSITIPVSANGLQPTGPEVLKLEMEFDNGGEGAFSKDVRNVDMRLEHPYGYVCDKAHANPTNWGMHGNPSWLAFPPREEPERIVLAGASVDAVYRVQLSYMEDCESLPSELLAGLLGISIDVLLDYLSGGIVPLDPSMVSQLISNICLDKSSSNVTVRAYSNGRQIGEKTVSVGRKGDTTYAMDIVRDGGTFEAR